MESGNCHSPPQPIVRPLKTEVCNFTKTSGSTKGAVGVLTYNIIREGCGDSKEMLAIIFSVPFDYNIYKNWVAVGIYDQPPNNQEKSTKKLYEEMYYKNQTSFTRAEANGCCIVYKGKVLDVMCTISPTGRSIMKVELWDKDTFS